MTEHIISSITEAYLELKLSKLPFVLKLPKLSYIEFINLSELFKNRDVSEELAEIKTNNDLKAWMKFWNKIDKSHAWFWQTLQISVIKSLPNFLPLLIKIFLSNFIVPRIEIGSKVDLFKKLAIHNDVILFFANEKENKPLSEPSKGLLNDTEGLLHLWAKLNALNVSRDANGEILTVYNFLSKLSYGEIEQFFRFGMVKELEDFASRAAFGLSEEGQREFDRKINELKNIVINDKFDWREKYFLSETIKDPNKMFSDTALKKMQKWLIPDHPDYIRYKKEYDRFHKQNIK